MKSFWQEKCKEPTSSNVCKNFFQNRKQQSNKLIYYKYRTTIVLERMKLEITFKLHCVT